jgi:uncharacterized protein YhfF
MAIELTELMLAGTKRATASLVRDFETTGEPLPQPGDYVIVVDGAYKPCCIWQTTEVTIKPLIDVDEAFAWDEGEGDRTRASWLNGHRRYFARQATREGFAIDDQIPTVFQDAVDATFAAFGIDATYTPAGGESVSVRVIARRPDTIVGFGDTRIHAETATFELRATEVANPRPGDQLTVGGETFVVQGEPERHDPDRLV